MSAALARWALGLGMALGLTGCAGATWQRALDQAAAGSVAEAELALVVQGDAARAAALAEARLERDEGPSTRAFLTLLAAADALGEVERPLPYLVAALDRLARTEHAEETLESAVTVVAQAQRAWARLDGQPAASPEVADALRRLVARIDAFEPAARDRWEATRAQAMRELITAARLQGGGAAAAIATKDAGFIQDWELSSPWGGAWLLDFRATQGPETRALLPVEHSGSGWGLIPPQTVRQRFSDGEVTFFDLPETGGVGFAQAELPAVEGAERVVVLRLETNRLAEVFVEGLGPDAVLKRNDPGAPWSREAVARLPVTKTRITVKFASPDGHGFFRLQVTPRTFTSSLTSGPDEGALATGDGARAIRQLVAIDAALSRPGWNPAWARVALATLERSLAGRCAGSRPAASASLAPNRVGEPRCSPPSAAGTASDARRGSPGEAPAPGPETVMDLLGARLALGDTSVPEAERRQTARARYEHILERNSSHSLARRGLARIERHEGRVDHAMRLLEPGLKDPRTALELLDLLRERGWEAEALALDAALAPLRVGSPRVMQEHIDTLSNFGRLAEARAAAEALEARSPGFGASRIYALEMDRGAAPVALETALFAAEPERHAALRAAVAGLRQQGALEEADRTVAAFLKDHPQDGWALGERVRIAVQAGAWDEARAKIAETLRQHPDFAPLESLEAHLAGTPERFDVLEDGVAVLERWRARARAETEEAPVVSVLERRRIRVERDGSTLELLHRIRVAQGRQGADALGDVRPPEGARLLVARTVKADGRVLEPERTPGKPTLSFPELMQGDAVETAWVTRSRVLPGEGGYLTGVSFANWGVPTEQLDVEITVAAGLAVAVTRFGEAPAPTEALGTDGARTVRWQLGPLAAVPQEPMAISARSFFPFADVRVERAAQAAEGFDEAWLAIARAYTVALEPLLRAGPRVRAVAEELRAARDPVEAAFLWVQREIGAAEELNTMQTAVEVALSTKKGNRSLVLEAIAASLVGDDGVVGLLFCAPERDGPPEDRAHPSPNANRFFYPVVTVKIGDRMRWFDPSRRYMPPGVLPPELAGAACLDPRAVARDGRAAWVTLPAPASDPTFTMTMDISVDKAGIGRGTFTLVAQGAQAAPLRQAFVALDPERQRVFVEQWVGTLSPGAQALSYEIEDMSQPERPGRLTVTLELPAWGHAEGQAMVVERLLPTLATHDLGGVPDLATLVGAPTRVTPLRLLPHHERVTLKVTWPDGWVLTEPPAAFQGGEVTQDVRVEGRTLVVTREAQVRPGRVSPAEYPAFRQAIARALRALEAPVRWRQP